MMQFTKKELLQYKEFFTVPKILLEIFEEDEIIPNQLVELMFHREEPKEYNWRVTPEIHNYVTNLIKQEYENNRNESKKL